MTTTLFAKDTSHRTVFPVFTAGGGFGMPRCKALGISSWCPIPATFRVLPWSPTTGWLLCDLYFADGRPVPFATRHLFARARAARAQRGYDSSPASRSSSTSSSSKTRNSRRRMPASPVSRPAVSLLSTATNI